MRVTIHVKHGLKLYLILPARLLLNKRLLQSIFKSAKLPGKLRVAAFREEDILRLRGELLRMKKKYRHLELVNIRAQDGTVVKVRL